MFNYLIFLFVIFTRELAQFQTMLINICFCKNYVLLFIFLVSIFYCANCVLLHTTVSFIGLNDAVSCTDIGIIHTYFYSFNLCQSPFLKDTCRAPLRPLIFGRTFNEFYNETSLHVKRNMFCCMQYTGNIAFVYICFMLLQVSNRRMECTKNCEEKILQMLVSNVPTYAEISQSWKSFLQTFQ